MTKRTHEFYTCNWKIQRSTYVLYVMLYIDRSAPWLDQCGEYGEYTMLSLGMSDSRCTLWCDLGGTVMWSSQIVLVLMICGYVSGVSVNHHAVSGLGHLQTRFIYHIIYTYTRLIFYIFICTYNNYNNCKKEMSFYSCNISSFFDQTSFCNDN